jgi:hypothetical protein
MGTPIQDEPDAMSAAAPAKNAGDPVAELARAIYVALTSRIYSGSGGVETGLPEPQALARLSFTLAEAFYAEDREANPITLAAAAAAKSAVKFNAADLDLGSLHQRR